VTHTLFIQLPSIGSEDNTPVDWALFSYDADGQNQKVAGDTQCPLSDVMSKTSDHPDKRIVALAPGNDVVQTIISVPAGQKKHLQRTLPFLIEEDIATPIEDMHLCAEPVQEGKTRVSVVSHQAMQYWQQLLKSAQIDADWLLADSAALTLDNQLNILLDPQRALFFCPGQAVINTEFDNLTFIAETLIEQCSSAGNDEAIKTGKLWVSHQLSETQQAATAALTTQFEIAGTTLQQRPISNHFDFCCTQLHSWLKQHQNEMPHNLLTGDYRSSSKQQNKKAPKWRLLAITASACLLIKLAVDIGSGFYLNQQTVKIDEEIKTLYHELFPQDKRIVNVKVQMQNHLKGQAVHSDSSFMPLFGFMAEAIANLNHADSVQLQQLRYNDENQTLLVDIHVKDVQQLEDIKQFIDARNVSASILSANEEREWIKGRVKLTL